LLYLRNNLNLNHQETEIVWFNFGAPEGIGTFNETLRVVVADGEGNTAASSINYVITTGCPAASQLPQATGADCVSDEEGLAWSAGSPAAWLNLYTGSGRVFAQINAGATTNLFIVNGRYHQPEGPVAITMPSGLVRYNRSYNFRFMNTDFQFPAQPDGPVQVRFSVSTQDMDALLAASPGSSLTTLRMIHSTDDCGEGSGADAYELPLTVEDFTCGANGYRITFSATEFSTFYLVATGADLPVELTGFTAEALPKQKVVLNWATATETDNSHFVVEHSTDGRSFTELGAVAGTGESTREQGYEYLHATPVAGANYYRLRQVDFDGAETLSELRRVEVIPAGKLVVFPNPAMDRLYVSGPAEGPVVVMDMNGRVVLQTQLRANSGLYVGELAGGVYLLRTGGEVVRWVKR